jgi:hypothetical protein
VVVEVEAQVHMLGEMEALVEEVRLTIQLVVVLVQVDKVIMVLQE